MDCVIADYFVIGSGLTDATTARTPVDQRKDVVMLDRRSHPGGNVHDFVHESGIRIHTYGYFDF